MFDWCDDVFMKCHVSATPAVTQTFQNKLNSSEYFSRRFVVTVVFGQMGGKYFSTQGQIWFGWFIVPIPTNSFELSCSDG